MRVIFVAIITLTGLALIFVGVTGLSKSSAVEGPTADKTYALLAQAGHFSSFVLGLLLIAVGNITEKLSSILTAQQKSVACLDAIGKLLYTQVKSTAQAHDGRVPPESI